MTKQLLLLNGPNLNLLGTRQPELYGHTTLDDVHQRCQALAQDLGLTIRCEQSNHEGILIDLIQEARSYADGIIINPGAYSHTSIALLDALNSFEGTVLEVHISNIHQREKFRHHSYVSLCADGVLVGLGVEGYELAVRRMASV